MGYPRMVNISTKLIRCQLFVVLIGACFEPEPAQCLPCKQGCPTDQACIEGLCQTQAAECTLGANTSLCGEQCCVDGACLDLKRHIPPDSLALWLDWTSLYQGQSAPIWRDRSSNAYRFTNDGPSPKLSSSSLSDANVLRFSAIGQYLSLDGPEHFALADSDFLLLAAGSLSCDAPNASAKQCLVTRLEEKSGFRLCATLDPEVPSQLATCAQDDASATCVTAVVSGVTCGRMQLLTLRRFSQPAVDGGTVSSLFELRRNAVTQAQLALDSGLELEVLGSLRIGGRAMLSFVGEIAMVALIVGTVDNRGTCELERFLLGRMAATQWATGDELPDCSAL